MINRVVLVGRMTRDPELRRTNTGSAVTSFTLALDRGFSSQD
ncbi:MAG: single-stranded DNA-binding protein, partial [bacterium]